MTKLYEAVFSPGSQSGKAATTTYQLFDAAGASQGPASGIGVSEVAPGTYAALITHADGLQGTIRWNTGGPSPAQAAETINPESTPAADFGTSDRAMLQQILESVQA